MTGLVRLRATMAYPYAGCSLQAGDEFDASERDARILKLVGRAEDAPRRQVSTKVVQPVPDESQDAASPSTTRPKRRYRRRDLTAE